MSFKSLILGLIAGVIATLTVHEIISWLFANYWTGWERTSWNTASVETIIPGVIMPKIVADMISGGFWGALIGLILGPRPRGRLTFRGAALGMLLPALLGVFILTPLRTGAFPMFFAGDMSKIIPTLVVCAGFGAATAWLYGWFRWGHLPGCDNC